MSMLFPIVIYTYRNMNKGRVIDVFVNYHIVTVFNEELNEFKVIITTKNKEKAATIAEQKQSKDPSLLVVHHEVSVDEDLSRGPIYIVTRLNNETNEATILGAKNSFMPASATLNYFRQLESGHQYDYRLITTRETL